MLRPGQRPPRTFEVVSCFDCGLVVNRVNEVHDSVYKVTDHACTECGEACGPWITVREVLPPPEDGPTEAQIEAGARALCESQEVGYPEGDSDYDREMRGLLHRDAEAVLRAAISPTKEER